MRASLKIFLLASLAVGSCFGYCVKWHFDSSNQFSALQRTVLQCVDAADGSNCYEAFLDDEIGIDENGMLIFIGRDYTTDEQGRVVKCGISFDRRYFCESPLVWVYETTEPLSNEIKRLKGVRQIVVWDDDTENATSLWQEWFPGVRVVTSHELGCVESD